MLRACCGQKCANFSFEERTIGIYVSKLALPCVLQGHSEEISVYILRCIALTGGFRLSLTAS